MVQYFAFPERKGPGFSLVACRKRKPTPSTESPPRAVLWKWSSLGGRHPRAGGSLGSRQPQCWRQAGIVCLTIPGRRESQVHLHSHSGHGKDAVRIGSWAFSLLCEFGQVTSLLWTKGVDHIRGTPPVETLRDTLYTSESSGSRLTLQPHNFHLHYCHLGWCPTLFHTQ